jgi:hypothetical protein
MELGMEKPGFLGKVTGGSFGTRRLLLAFRPDDREWGESFAAFETYAIDGPGAGRSGDRSSFVGHLAWVESDKSWRNVIAIGSARFDFPGFLPQEAVERGAYPYDTTLPLGRDRTSQAFTGTEFTWGLENGTISVGAFAMKAKTQIRQDLTGFLPDGNPDDHEQVNDASGFGLNAMYRRRVDLISDRDIVEVGTYARVDTVTQSDTRLLPDGTVGAKPVDATINATNIAAYVDAYVYPVKRVVVRGGTRLDSLSYSITDRAANLGLDRTAQGFHVGNKATIDYVAGGGVHLVASYGEGFRSPQARDLAEGARVPFAVVQSGEAGARVKVSREWQASVVGFGSWLDQDRVFDAITRTSIAAPSSSRLGSAAALGGRWGAFGTNVSATWVHAVFTGSDANFQKGDAVPYAPAFVLRDDAFVVHELGKLRADPVTGRFGLGLQGAAGVVVPGGRAGKSLFYLDALASVGWRALELSVNGMNLLGLRYYDAQYVYASTFGHPGATPHVLVATPTSVFATLQVRLEGAKHPDGV